MTGKANDIGLTATGECRMRPWNGAASGGATPRWRGGQWPISPGESAPCRLAVVASGGVGHTIGQSMPRRYAIIASNGDGHTIGQSAPRRWALWPAGAAGAAGGSAPRRSARAAPLGHARLRPLAGEVRSGGLPTIGEARVRPLVGEARGGDTNMMAGCPLRPLAGKVRGSALGNRGRRQRRCFGGPARPVAAAYPQRGIGLRAPCLAMSAGTVRYLALWRRFSCKLEDCTRYTAWPWD